MKKNTSIKILSGLFISIVILVLIIPSIPINAAGTFSYYAAITIDHTKVEGDYSDFPILISDTYDGTAGEPDLRTAANGGNIENTVSGGITGSLTVPADLVFSSNADGTDQYDFEYLDYDAATGEIIVYVEIPTMDASDDYNFYMSYGDSSQTTSNEDINGTWSSYDAVYHLNNQLKDSSGNLSDLTEISTPSGYASGGPLGLGYYSFSGGGTDGLYVNEATADGLPLTLSMWFYDTGVDATDFLAWDGDKDQTDYYVSVHAQGSSAGDPFRAYSHQYGGTSANAETTTGFSASTWYLGTGVFTSDSARAAFINGASKGTDTTTTGTPAGHDRITIGYLGDSTPAYPTNTVRISEMRIVNYSEPDGWVLTTYNSYISSSFYSVGSETEASTPTDTPTPSDTPTATATTVPGSIIMGYPSVSLPPGLEDAIKTGLESYRPDDDLDLDEEEIANMWAITSYNESKTTDYYWVSLAGMLVPDDEDLNGWDLSYAIWTGLSLAYDNGDTTFTAYIYGSEDYDLLVDTAGLVDIGTPNEGGSGSYGYYFPWAAGYKAYYGTKGVHGAGPSDPAWGGVGWAAVDWVGGAVGYSADIFPNGAYVSQSGTVSYVCQDDIQTWVKIGNFLYGHLVDNSTLRMDVYHSQGSYLGAIVTGTHLTPATSGACTCPSNRPDCIDAKCGYMCQQETSYHIHWGFIPDGDYFTTEDWTLNKNTEYWYNGSYSVGPGQYMLANWSSRPIVPTPGPTVTPGGPTVTPGAPIIVGDGGGGGGQIWDGFIAGMQAAVNRRIDDIHGLGEYGDNLHEDRHIVTLTLSGARIAIRSTYLLLRSNLNLTITMIVVTLLFILEPIRLLRGVWVAIKEMIPFIG